jgi:hypothetical protein
MVAIDNTQNGALRSCSAIANTPQAFGHSHAITPKAHCSFLLWAQEQKSYIAVQAL